MKLNLILRVLALASFTIFLIYSFYKIPQLTSSYTSYYTHSRMLLEGDSLSNVYNDEKFNEKINEYGIRNIYDINYDSPITAIVLLPFALIDPLPAKILYGVFSILMFMISIWLLFNIYEIEITGNNGLLLLCVIFLWHPLYENIAVGQIYVIILFLFTLSLSGIKKSKNFLTAIPLSLSILTKGYGVFLYLWLLMKKRYKAIFISIIIISLILLITLPFLDIHTWKEYFEIISSKLGKSDTDSNLAYQTVNGFLRHLLIYNKDLNPHSLLNLSPTIVFYIVIIVNLAIILLVLMKSQKNTGDTHSYLLSYSAIIAASVTTSPMGEEYVYVLFLPLIIGLGYEFFKNNSVQKSIGFTISNILFIFAVLEIIVPFHYKNLQAAAFPAYLLGYPKLYGGLILLSIYYFSNKNSPVQISHEQS
jgi:hypothetical protein